MYIDFLDIDSLDIDFLDNDVLHIDFFYTAYLVQSASSSGVAST